MSNTRETGGLLVVERRPRPMHVPIESIPVPCFACRREGPVFRVEAANALALGLVGMTLEEIRRARFEDAPPSLVGAFDEAVREARTVRLEHSQRLPKSDHERHFLLTVVPTNGERALVYVQEGAGIPTDVEGRYAALFEQSSAGIITYDKDLRVTDCNPRILEILHLPRECLLGFDLGAVSDTSPLRVLRGALAGEPQTFVGPYRMTLANLDLVVKVRAVPVRDRGGTVVGGICLTEDITEQGRQQERVRSQFKGIPVPTFSWLHRATEAGDDFELIDFNDAADALSRGRLSTLLGKTLLGGIAHPPTAIGDMMRSLRERALVFREVEHVMNTTGEKKSLAVTYSPVPPDLVLLHVEDVTERRKLEEQLRQAQKMEAVGQLASGVAHDFNNILTVIASYCDLVTAQLDPDSTAYDDVRGIRDAAERAAVLTRQLLAFSRKQVLRPHSIDLNAALRGIEPMLRRLIGEDIRVVMRLAPDVGSILADSGQIEQVIVNLAVNARDAMPNGGVLTMTTAAIAGPTPRVILTVHDTGKGMDADTRRRAFEPFFTTKEHGRGTGLGLSTVYGIVKQSGGEISVESEPGRGTTFELVFPLQVTASPTADSVPPVAAPGHGSEVVLLAEDVDALRTVCHRLLLQQGYTVLAASNGREALELAERFEGRIDLLLTDMVMPERGGPDLYDELRAKRPGLRVLYMSGYTDHEKLGLGRLGPGAVLLQKPFSSSQLSTAVRAALDQNASSRSG